MEKFICQSCGMPMIKNSDFGSNSDGSMNADYCKYCFANGNFCEEQTLEEKIELCIPFEINGKDIPDEAAARKYLSDFLPTLKRWRNC